MVQRLRISTAAVTALAVLVVAGCGGAPSQTEASSTPSTTQRDSAETADPSTTPEASATTDASDPTPTTPVAPTPTPTATPTATPTPTGPPDPLADGVLRPQEAGPAVLAAQERLVALGYWLGEPDGEYGTLTSQAVMALQKAAGLDRDGLLGAGTQEALDAGTRPTARSTSGHVIEVDLDSQLLMVVDDGEVSHVLNTSTGNGERYTSRGVTAVAATPAGSFEISREIDGMRVSHLGELWRPKYFNGGIAFHGSPSVPAYAASHGCVRLTNPAIDWLWSSDLAPIGTSVEVY